MTGIYARLAIERWQEVSMGVDTFLEGHVEN